MLSKRYPNIATPNSFPISGIPHHGHMYRKCACQEGRHQVLRETRWMSLQHLNRACPRIFFILSSSTNECHKSLTKDGAGNLALDCLVCLNDGLDGIGLGRLGGCCWWGCSCNWQRGAYICTTIHQIHCEHKHGKKQRA